MIIKLKLLFFNHRCGSKFEVLERNIDYRIQRICKVIQQEQCSHFVEAHGRRSYSVSTTSYHYRKLIYTVMGANSYLSVYFFVHHYLISWSLLQNCYLGITLMQQQLFDLKRHTSASDGTADDWDTPQKGHSSLISLTWLEFTRVHVNLYLAAQS